jgi:hypothetical protein
MNHPFLEYDELRISSKRNLQSILSESVKFGMKDIYEENFDAISDRILKDLGTPP